MHEKLKRALLILVLMTTAAMSVHAGGSQEKESDEVGAASENKEVRNIDDVAAALGVTTVELTAALGDPSQGAPDFPEAAGKLGVSAEKLEELMKMIMGGGESVEVDPHTITLNGLDIEITFEVFGWDELPSDVEYERQEIQTFTNAAGETHYYEVIYVKSGNLNWYQAAYLAEDAGAYLACPATEEENAFVFSLVNDTKYFWSFPEEGNHYGISIGPFLGGYQPDGSPEPDGGWLWLSGEPWEYTNWAVNLDDGVIDKDPRPNDQPNNSGGSQPIMGFGEMNLPVPTWGDYMENVGTYGVTRGPGNSYGFIIEYESDPR
jgi:hypothetical protein